MNIHIPTGPFYLGCLVTLVAIIAYIFLYRLYKRIGRRCRKKNCGSIQVERKSLIFLADDETISLRSVDGKRRWFIWRVYSVTFAVCQDPKCGFKEFVKFNGGPFSYWHLWWVQKFKPEQLRGDQELENRFYFALRDLIDRRRNKIDKHSVYTDTPDIKIEYTDLRQ